MTKPDLILRRRSDDTLHYVEFKSAGQDSYKWRKKFESGQWAIRAPRAATRSHSLAERWIAWARIVRAPTSPVAS